MEIAVIIGVVVGLTQLFKGMKVVPVKYLPLLSLVFGVLGGIAYGGGELKENIIMGVMIGLSASGLFDQTKIVSKKVKK